MAWLRLLVSALEFVLFVPGVLVTLPPGGSRWTVLAVHGLLFALLHWAVQRGLMRLL
jgi:hypothetical protein